MRKSERAAFLSCDLCQVFNNQHGTGSRVHFSRLSLARPRASGYAPSQSDLRSALSGAPARILRAARRLSIVSPLCTGRGRICRTGPLEQRHSIAFVIFFRAFKLHTVFLVRALVCARVVSRPRFPARTQSPRTAKQARRFDARCICRPGAFARVQHRPKRQPVCADRGLHFRGCVIHRGLIDRPWKYRLPSNRPSAVFFFFPTVHSSINCGFISREIYIYLRH